MGEGGRVVEGEGFVKVQELEGEAEANKNMYEQFLSRFKATNEQRLLQVSQTKIASLATPPIRSTRPPLALLLAALVIASILISTAAVAVLDTRRNSPEPGLKAPRADSTSAQPEPPQEL